MDPRTGYVYDLKDLPEADPPYFGAKIGADAALAQGLVETDGLEDDQRARLEEMAAKSEDLIAVEAAAAQRLRLGDRELRRRKQRRR